MIDQHEPTNLRLSVNTPGVLFYKPLCYILIVRSKREGKWKVR